MAPVPDLGSCFAVDSISAFDEGFDLGSEPAFVGCFDENSRPDSSADSPPDSRTDSPPDSTLRCISQLVEGAGRAWELDSAPESAVESEADFVIGFVVVASLDGIESSCLP